MWIRPTVTRGTSKRVIMSRNVNQTNRDSSHTQTCHTAVFVAVAGYQHYRVCDGDWAVSAQGTNNRCRFTRVLLGTWRSYSAWLGVPLPTLAISTDRRVTAHHSRIRSNLVSHYTIGGQQVYVLLLLLHDHRRGYLNSLRRTVFDRLCLFVLTLVVSKITRKGPEAFGIYSQWSCRDHAIKRQDCGNDTLSGVPCVAASKEYLTFTCIFQL